MLTTSCQILTIIQPRPLNLCLYFFVSNSLHCILRRKSETSLDKSFMGDKRPGLSMKQCFRRMSTEYEMCDLTTYNLVSTINGLGLFTASRLQK